MWISMCIYKNLSLPLTVASSLSWGRKFCNFFTLLISYWQKVFTIVSYGKWCVVSSSSSSSSSQLKLWKVTEQNGNKESLFLFLPLLSKNKTKQNIQLAFFSSESNGTILLLNTWYVLLLNKGVSGNFQWKVCQLLLLLKL